MKTKTISLFLVLITVSFSLTARATDKSVLPEIISSTNAGNALIQDLLKGYAESTGKTLDLKNQTALRWFAIEEFGVKRYGGLLHSKLSFQDKQLMKLRLKVRNARVKNTNIGEFRVFCVVNRKNTVSKITLEGIGLLLKDGESPASWKAAGGADLKVKCYLEDEDSAGREIVRWKCLTWKKKTGSGRYLYRNDAVTCANPAEILRKVAADRQGMGLFVYDPNDEEIAGLLKLVKVLEVGLSSKGPYVKPQTSTGYQNDYPLSEAAVLYIHPEAPAELSALAEYCVSLGGAKIASGHGLITGWDKYQHQAVQRLAEMKQGKGERIYAVGDADFKQLIDALGHEYVRTRKVVQLRYLPATGFGAVNMFAGGRGDLLLAGGPIDERFMKTQQGRWDAFWKGRKDKPGTPEEYRLSRMRMYVSPKAGSATRDFVKFILNDAPKEILKKHGFKTNSPPKELPPKKQDKAPAVKSTSKPKTSAFGERKKPPVMKDDGLGDWLFEKK